MNTSKWLPAVLMSILVIQLALAAALFLRLSALEKRVSRLEASRTMAEFGSVIEGKIENFTALVEGRPYRGPTFAPITIVEFSDFMCPACRLSQPVIAQLLTTSEKDIKFVHRHFPLTPPGTAAFSAAMAAECANEQHAFWPMHDILFTGSDELSTEDLLGYAARLSLDQVAFEECIRSSATTETISHDISIGRDYAVSSTPTFFINGYKIVGSYSMEAMEAILRKIFVTTEG